MTRARKRRRYRRRTKMMARIDRLYGKNFVVRKWGGYKAGLCVQVESWCRSTPTEPAP